ncbi:unnamed protein product [Rotaria magnacalcarata]|uniref:Reverse transcriptase domain-containing protein n=1 Tax=Rotaria magnacalcarata TaxID=392030 RepID=A0A8S2LAX0_9BILA|nr:unnamed protein product [Rotaria magnacalcarata]
MNDIVNDTSAFININVDPTITQEEKLIRKLNHLHSTGFLTSEELKICKPSGSQPARIYGLPKIHKLGSPPLRPTLSACGTFNYGLTIMLAKRLKYLRKHETVTRDTFSFIEDLRKHCNGSPLGPVFADIFMIHLEKELMPTLRKNGVLWWRRFVDDSFTILSDTTGINVLKQILNSYHKNIQFTHTEEEDNTIPFLDVLLTHTHSATTPYFNTSAYRKPTYSVLNING